MNKKAQESYAGLITFGVLLFVVVVGLAMSVYIIPAGERGILLTWGEPSMDSVGEGLHFKMPIAQTVKKMEVRTQKIEAASDSASRDLQDVQTAIALNFHILPESAPRLYQEVGFAYKERIIDPAIQESVKSVTAQFTAEELITKRPEVRVKMQEAITEKLAKYYLQVDSFNIVNFQFSASFDAAIEDKVTAEQKKLKAERDLERIIIEKEQLIATAQAEAESLRLQKNEITPELIELRKVEAQIAAIEKWNGQMPTVTGGVMPFLDVNTVKPQAQVA